MDVATARARAAARWRLNAFVTMTTEQGDGPVVAVKDNIDVRGVPTTVGSPSRPAQPASVDAEVIAALRAHGGVVIGKTNLGEWALDVTGIAHAFGPVQHPHDPACTAGGSSSGSAVAVAAGLCDWAIGSDTGGSVRLPAALCGVVGVKPTHGLLATRGLVPSCPSMDTIGPLAPTVAGAARALEALGGPAWRDPGPRPEPRVATPRGWVDALDAPTVAAWVPVATGLPEIDLPPPAAFRDAFLALGPPEASRFHASTLADPTATLGPTIRAVLERGAEVRAVDYLAAVETTGELRAAVDDALRSLDALVLPTSGVVAPRLEDAPRMREDLTRFVRPFSLTGHPVVTLPVRSAGLPVGVQVVGRRGGDAELLRVASALERRYGVERVPVDEASG